MWVPRRCSDEIQGVMGNRGSRRVVEVEEEGPLPLRIREAEGAWDGHRAACLDSRASAKVKTMMLS